MWQRFLLASLAALFSPVLCMAEPAPRSLVAVAPRDPWTLRELEALHLDLVSYDPETGLTYLTVTPLDEARLVAKGFLVTTVEPDAEAGLKRLQLQPDLGLYHTFEETESELQDLHATYAAISNLEVIGNSLEGRPIYALKISDDPQVDDPEEPDVLFVGNHHARELMSVEVPLYFARWLLEHYSKSLEVRQLVETREVWIVPLLNPDGHVFQQSFQRRPGWRKNRRENFDGTFGVDLNRNYSYHWGFDDEGSSPSTLSETYRGETPFSEPETDAIRRLAERQDFKIAISYHSFGSLLLYPWGWTRNELTPDHSVYVVLADSMVRDNGYRPGNAASGAIYITNGDMDDYMYGELTPRKEEPTFAFTVELNTQAQGGFWPAEELIAPTQESMLSLNRFALRVADNLRGTVPPPIPVLTANQDPVEPWRIELSWEIAPDVHNPIEHYEVFEIDPNGIEKAVQLAQKVELRSPGRASLVSGFRVPDSGLLGIRLESRLEPLWDYAYVEVQEPGGGWQALAAEKTSDRNPTGRNAGRGITGSLSPQLLHFDASAFAGREIEVSLRMDPHPESPLQSWIRAEMDFPSTLTESRRIIAPDVRETHYTVIADRIGLFGYGVTAVDTDGQTSESSVQWFHIPTIVAVEVQDVELSARGTTLELRWRTWCEDEAHFAAWARPLQDDQSVEDVQGEWRRTDYQLVAEARVESRTTAALTWQAQPGRYAVLLRSRDRDGNRLWGPWVAAATASTHLHPAIPNPFNPQTRLRFELAREGHVELDVFDVHGKLVRRLLSEIRPAGEHTITWNGLDESSRAAASGVYVACLRHGGQRETQRLVLLR